LSIEKGEHDKTRPREEKRRQDKRRTREERTPSVERERMLEAILEDGNTGVGELTKKEREKEEI
jgi:hypothetical protein